MCPPTGSGTGSASSGCSATPILDAIKIDPDWPHPERSVNEANDRLRAQLTEYIESQLADRPELVDKVVPDYPPYAKRMVVDNGWYQALRRDNVTLVTAPISAHHRDRHRVRPTATATSTCWCSPPASTRTGCCGRSRSPAGAGWTCGPGSTRRPRPTTAWPSADCPNLLMTYGPHGVPAHGGNGMFFAETAIGYITEVMRGMFDSGARSMTVREEVLRGYVEELCSELPNFVQSLPGLDNWYRGDRDRVTTIAPKTVLEFWTDCRSPAREAYAFG